jgi:hypothetical protein
MADSEPVDSVPDSVPVDSVPDSVPVDSVPDSVPDRLVHSVLNQSLRGGFSLAIQKALQAAIAAVEKEKVDQRKS